MIRKAIEVDRIQRREDPEDDQDNAAYLDSLGWVLFRKGKPEEALEWLEEIGQALRKARTTEPCGTISATSIQSSSSRRRPGKRTRKP